MTGTGTQTDPFIIQNWDDFYGVTDLASYYKLGCDLDANDCNDGVWTACTLSCKELDGGGHTVRNIFYQVAGASDTKPQAFAIIIPAACTIKNITFENINSNVALFATKTQSKSYSISFENVRIYADTFAVFAASYFSSGSFNHRFHCLGCEISHKGKVMNYLHSGTNSNNYFLTLENCHVYIEETGTANSSNNLRNVRVLNTRMEGLYNFYTKSDYFHTLQNSVIALKNINNAVFEWDVVGDTVLPSVVDSTIANCNILGTGIVVGTTEQLQNADWLNANGFAVISV